MIKWLRNRFEATPFPFAGVPQDEERSFPLPPVQQAGDWTPPAVIRHLKIIEQAMNEGDRATVTNRQIRLAKLGVEVPTKLSHVRDMLEKYGAT
jgi:hypothetical protein